MPNEPESVAPTDGVSEGHHQSGNGSASSTGSAAWYRRRAAEVRYNWKVISQYNHFLGIAEAIERTQAETPPNDAHHELDGRERELVSAIDALMEIVEGVRGERWAANGIRLVDTREWCAFYRARHQNRVGSWRIYEGAAP